MESILKSDLTTRINNMTSIKGRKPVLFYEGNLSDVPSPIICTEIFKEIDFNKVNKLKLISTEEAVNNLIGKNEIEKKVVQECKEIFHSMNEHNFLKRDEKLSKTLDEIDSFLNELQDEANQLFNEITPMLKPLVIGNADLESHASLVSNYENTLTLEEDLLKHENETHSGKDKQLALRNILESHIQKKVWKKLTKNIEKNTLNKNSLNKEIKINTTKIKNMESHIEKDMNDFCANTLRYAQSIANSKHLHSILKQHFDCPGGDPMSLNCGLSKDGTIAYCKGEGRGCQGWGKYPLAIWGSGPYTDESSHCLMGVHSGFYSRESGGVYRFKKTGQRTGFEASTKNGITSHPWETYNAIEVSSYFDNQQQKNEFKT